MFNMEAQNLIHNSKEIDEQLIEQLLSIQENAQNNNQMSQPNLENINDNFVNINQP